MLDNPVGLISSAASDKLLRSAKAVQVNTPWGTAEVWTGQIGGRDAACVLRYGKGLTTPSHKINYRANIWALRELGVRQIISQNAIGSVNPALRPGDIVIPHDFLDKTKSRALSLFDEEQCWVRVDMTRPFCESVRKALITAASALSDRVIERGVFVCTEGPRFETPSEIRSYQMEGGDIIGTPLVPEVVLAREAEMCFGSVSPIINFGAGMAPEVAHFGPGSMNDLYYTGGLHDLVEKTIEAAVVALDGQHSCRCGTALKAGFHGQKPAWLTNSSLDR